jgi:hypothetical protein
MGAQMQQLVEHRYSMRSPDAYVPGNIDAAI